MVKKFQDKLPEMWKASPPWFALLAVVVIFVYYMDRQEQRVIDREIRAEALSALRIESCHKVQQESTGAIKELNAILREQATGFDRLTRAIEKLE